MVKKQRQCGGGKRGLFKTVVFPGVIAVCISFLSAGMAQAESSLIKHTGRKPSEVLGSYYRIYSGGGETAWTCEEPVPGSPIYLYDTQSKANANLSFWAEEQNIIYGVGDYAGWKISPSDTTQLSRFIPRSESFVSANEGYHIYDAIREKTEIDLMGWKCTWRRGTCCHFYHPSVPGVENQTFCGLYRFKNKTGVTTRCGMAYFSGWVPICADCGEYVDGAHHYLSKESASKISALDTRLAYIYRCQNCEGMEQGIVYISHECKLVSPNRYRVVYNANASEYEGSIPDSFFTYMNLREYEGENFGSSNPSLSQVNSVLVNGKKQDILRRQGYRFKCWNTKPDGSGVNIPDGYRIPDDPAQNLLGEVCKKQYIPGTNSIENGTITLYAQWERFGMTLVLDTKGGRYNESGYSASISGGKTTLTLSYGEAYSIQSGKLTVPSGFRVSFKNSSNINDTVHSDMYAERRFTGWALTSGDTDTSILERESSATLWKYRSFGVKGSSATVTANYVDGKIILPSPNANRMVVGGKSFYGWSTTADGSNIVGQAGAEYYPTGNVTLYACYGGLVLDAKENYSVNGGKGAIDLSWKWDVAMVSSHVYAPYISEPNGSNSEAKRAYNNISGSNGLGSAENVDITKSGYQVGAYIIPTNGFYTFTLGGAAGGNYTNGSIRKTGGSGGEVTFGVYLKRGDRVDYVLGEKGGDNTVSGSSWTRCSSARGGYQGGNNGVDGAAGGGASLIKINGVLYAIAGGGGGASKDYNGGNGTGGMNTATGYSASYGQEGYSGQSSGGGGGYRGGAAGQSIIKYHTHSASCGTHIHKAYTGAGTLLNINRKISTVGEAGTAYEGYIGGSGTCFTQAITGWDYVGDIHSSWGNCYDIEDDGMCNGSGNSYTMAECPGHYYAGLKTSTVRDKYKNWKNLECGKNYFACDCFEHLAGTHYSWQIYGSEPLNTLMVESGFFSGTIAPKWTAMPDYVKNHTPYHSGKVGELYTKGISRYSITCAYKNLDYTNNPQGYLCNKTTSTVESRIVTQSKGGSCYCRTDTTRAGFGTATGYSGAGYIRIRSTAAIQGSVDATALSGLPANDTASPKKLSISSVDCKFVGGTVEVTFFGTKDNGTVYRNRVLAYRKTDGSFASRSNETVTTLASGVGGYYYRFDTSPGTQIDSGSKISLPSRLTDDSANTHTVRMDAANMALLTQGAVVYCHLVAYDRAGNCTKGDTIHYKIAGSGVDSVKVIEIKTEQMEVSSRMTPTGRDYNNIKSLGSNKYVVRADGSPILLGFSAYTNFNVATTYQIDSMCYRMLCNDGSSQSVAITLPYSTPATSTEPLASGSFVRSATGCSLLRDASIAEANRTNNGNRTHIEQAFSVPANLHGKEITVYPSAAITNILEGNGASVDRDDRTKGITLIADGKPPIIQGIDALETILAQPIALGQSIPTVSISAADEGSAGMESLEIAIQNLQSGEVKWLYSDGSAIAVDLNQEGIYTSNLRITIKVTDAVGNQTIREIKYWAYHVSAFIERVLSPHEPVFKSGESGLLRIIASEKVDKVEVRFPVILSDIEPELNQWVVFGKAATEKRETLLFQVPLGTPEGEEYAVELYPYADGVLLNPNPVKCYFQVKGSVLDELRTRLR